MCSVALLLKIKQNEIYNLNCPLKEQSEKNENKMLDLGEKLFKKQKKKQSKQEAQSEVHQKSWNETKIFVLPLMPSDAEEKYVNFFFSRKIFSYSVYNFIFACFLSLAWIKSIDVLTVMNCVIKKI